MGITAGFLVTGIIFAAYHAPTQGALIITSSLAGLVGTFVYGTNTRRSEREKQQKKLLESAAKRAKSSDKDNEEPSDAE